MTFANQLDTQIGAIVNGGYQDPLDDDAIYNMARRLDKDAQFIRDVTRRCVIVFADGSYYDLTK